MPTLHTIARCGKVTHVGVPREYNIAFLDCEKNGSLEKTYSLKSKAKTTIKSSLIKMWYEKRNRLTFWTFTFKLTDETRSVVCNQKILNTYFSALLENAKKCYGLHSYIWVSERTQQGTIHYHCIFDVPKLEMAKKKTLDEIKKNGSKVFEHFMQYYKTSFRALLYRHGVNASDSVDYCSVGFPSKYDSCGNYRGSVVRNVNSLAVYLAGYLAKCSRIETEGRIYAISRNVLQKTVKTYNYCEPFAPISTTNYEYCSVDYYNLSKGFDDFFLKESEEEKNAIVTESDLLRKHKIKDRIERKKDRKISEDLKITEYFYRKYIKNADILKFSNYFSSIPESSYHNIKKVKDLREKCAKLAEKHAENKIFLQGYLDFMS